MARSNDRWTGRRYLQQSLAMGDDDQERRERRNRKDNKRDREPSLLRTFLEKCFALLEGPIASSIVRLIATAMIGATTIGLTGIMAMANAPMGALLATVAFGGIGTTAVWAFAGRRSRNSRLPDVAGGKEITFLETRLAELEDRVANVEVIESFESRLATRTRFETDFNAGDETSYGSSGAISE